MMTLYTVYMKVNVQQSELFATILLSCIGRFLGGVPVKQKEGEQVISNAVVQAQKNLKKVLAHSSLSHDLINANRLKNQAENLFLSSQLTVFGMEYHVSKYWYF